MYAPARLRLAIFIPEVEEKGGAPRTFFTDLCFSAAWTRKERCGTESSSTLRVLDGRAGIAVPLGYQEKPEWEPGLARRSVRLHRRHDGPFHLTSSMRSIAAPS